jgi:hypothetical protein
VAVTPGIVVSTVLSLAGIGVPAAMLLYLLLSLAYLFFGVKAVAEEEQQSAKVD